MLKNGEVADVDEVLNNCIGTPFKNQAQLIFNAAYIGFNSKLNVATGVPNLKNVKYDVFSTDTATTKTNMYYDDTDEQYLTLDFLDQSADTTASDDGAGSFSDIDNAFDENPDTYARAVYSVSPFTSVSNTTYLGKTWAVARTIKYIKFKVKVSGGSTSQSQTIKVQSYNGSTWDDEETYTDGTIDYTLEANYYLNKSCYGIRIEIASTSNRSGSGSISAVHDYYLINYSIGTTGNGTLIFQTTSLPTIKDCMATWNSLIDSDNTLTVSISADGTNYEEVTDATIHRFTNTGTNLYIKFEIDRVDTEAIDKISEYAIIYNITE